jgi:hypothetical protein
VSYHPFAGRGPCGRPHPGWEIGYPAMADGHKGEAAAKVFLTKTVSKHLFCPPQKKIGVKYRKFGLYPHQRRS